MESEKCRLKTEVEGGLKVSKEGTREAEETQLTNTYGQK